MRTSTAGWKQSLYESYVSSGQAGDSGLSAAQHFAPRRVFLNDLIRRHIPRNRGIRIVDVGCGHGALLYFLHLHGYTNVQGVEGSSEQIALAGRLGVAGVAQGEARDFLRTMDSESVDVIFLMDVIEHLDRAEMWELLQDVRRVIRSGFQMRLVYLGWAYDTAI